MTQPGDRRLPAGRAARPAAGRGNGNGKGKGKGSNPLPHKALDAVPGAIQTSQQQGNSFHNSC